MIKSRWQLRLLLCCVSLSLGLIAFSSLQADYIFFKDGYVLQGTPMKVYENITDSSGIHVPISKLGGFYFVDDRVRRIYFSQSLVGSADPLDRSDQLEQFVFRPNNKQWHPSNSALKPYKLTKTGEWKPDGTRPLDMISRSAPTEIQVDQCIEKLSPTAMEVSTKRFTNTFTQYLTKEFTPEALLPILRQRIRTEAAEQKRSVTFDDRLRVARFLGQAGWYDQAQKELTEIAKDFPPTELPRLTQVREDLKKSQVKLKLEEIEDAVVAGQHTFAQNLMTSMDQDGADAQDLTRLSTFRNKHKQQNADLERLRKLLSQARQRAGSSSLALTAASLLDEIDRDLNLDNAKVLSVFLRLAEQEERFAAKGQPSVLNPEQLLALALTGWLQGSEAADQSKAAAERLLRGREFLQTFLVTDDDFARQKMLSDYLAKSPLKADEVVQLIDQLPPAQAETISKSILDLVTRSTTNWPKGVKYRVYLPPEYHHHRSYPLLILPPNFGENYETATASWLEPAARKGFIVAVPEWVDSQQNQYQSSDKEQEAVLETLRDMRRRFRIDSNRVSLAGFSSGGSLVFDVALTRPHLFASAAVICGHAPEGMEKLRYNAQYLPFYIVDASRNPYREKIGSAKKDALMLLFEYWIPKGYPSLLVEYQGRGFEQFIAEPANIIDWMSRKKRAAAMPELGKADLSGDRRGQEFRIIRPSANRFYWIGVGDHQASEQAPVLVSGGWEKDYPNSLRCVMTGMKKARIWINSSMVNFENPVEIRIQGPPGSTWQSHFKKKLEPNLGVLLEDYYQRGDSKNLFVQYVDFTFSR
ncbi:MAG TPA: alpha/beta hydrolase-fold protein [Gemmatales bacterium]|nr:alpha/beta hydrolase-fold protein [Gemmatales bacterium]